MGGRTRSRLKEQLLRQAVEDNVRTMRGMAAWIEANRRRQTHSWLRRASGFFVPLAILGSSYLIGSWRTAPAQATTAAVVDTTRAQIARTHATRGGTSSFAAPSPIDPSAFPLDVKRVILDAGHGGKDPGAIAGTVVEKEVTLDIERRLQAMLEKSGFEVRTTREYDATVPLKGRAEFANRSDGDIFVSIHINSIRSSTNSRGVETFYLGATNDPTLTRLANAENQESGYSLNDMRRLLEGIYADVRQDESRKLADAVQADLYGTLRPANPPLENWGVRRAPFVVLVATEMPAVLAEVSCLSNGDEARMLTNPAYRERIAQALFNGIRTYAQTRNVSKEKGT